MLGSVFGSFLLSMVYCGPFPSLTTLGSSFWSPSSATISSSPFPLAWSLQGLFKPSTVYCGRFPLLTARGISWVVSSRYCHGVVLVVSFLVMTIITLFLSLVLNTAALLSMLHVVYYGKTPDGPPPLNHQRSVSPYYLQCN